MGALYRVVTVVGAAALPKGGEDLPKSECVATAATTTTTTVVPGVTARLPGASNQ